MMEMPPLPHELTELFNADRFTCSEMERMIREYGESCARMAREEAAKEWETDALRYQWLREESGVVASFTGLGLSTGAKSPKDMRQLDERIDQIRKG